MAGRSPVLQKNPEWETKLWSFIGSGDGSFCPLLHNCQIRSSGGWCPNHYLDKLNRAIDDERCTLDSFDFLRYDKYCFMFLMLERLAKKYLESGRIYKPPVPENLISLFGQQNKLEVRTVPLRACHGALWRLQEGWIIYLSSNETTAMKRFVLFHEAFHVLAHSNTKPIFNKFSGVRGEFNEMLADFFACSLLLPRKWAKDMLSEVRDVKRIAGIFDIPQPFVFIRLRRMGLI